MTFASFRSLLRSRHLGWVLAFALWLPAAQWAAATHALLHLGAATAERGEPPAHLPSSCDTCVVAAAIGGAAPVAEVVAALPPRLPVAQPPASVVRSHPLAPAAAYRSRAPPLPHA